MNGSPDRHQVEMCLLFDWACGQTEGQFDVGTAVILSITSRKKMETCPQVELGWFANDQANRSVAVRSYEWLAGNRVPLSWVSNTRLSRDLSAASFPDADCIGFQFLSHRIANGCFPVQSGTEFTSRSVPVRIRPTMNFRLKPTLCA